MKVKCEELLPDRLLLLDRPLPLRDPDLEREPIVDNGKVH